MEEVALLIALFAVMLGSFIYLYDQGYMVFKSISAVTFIGSTKSNSARFSSCSGFTKRAVKIKENGTYTFVLDAELSKGDMSVELLDSNKQRIMQLDGSNRRASIPVEKKKKYYLIINFRAATGRYALIQE